MMLRKLNDAGDVDDSAGATRAHAACLQMLYQNNISKKCNKSRIKSVSEDTVQGPAMKGKAIDRSYEGR